MSKSKLSNLRVSRFELRRRATKKSEYIAFEILRDIVAQGLKPKDKLPLESEMLTRYEVSRSSLREALRLLEVQGLITIRPGPGAGTLVGSVDPANLSSTLMLYLYMTQAKLEDLLDAWLMVEPLLARLAAQRSDRKVVEELMAPFLEDGDGDNRDFGSGLGFHDVVAELAGNQVLTLMLGAIGYLVTDQVRLAMPDASLSDDTLEAHYELAQAIMDGEADKAQQLMYQHVEQVIAEIRELVPARMERPLVLGRS